MLTSIYFLIQYSFLFILAMALFLHVAGFYNKISKTNKKPLIRLQLVIILIVSIISVVKVNEISNIAAIVFGTFGAITLINAMLASVVYYKSGAFLND